MFFRQITGSQRPNLAECRDFSSFLANSGSVLNLNMMLVPHQKCIMMR